MAHTFTIVGNITREPEITYLESGRAMAKAGVAENVFKKGETIPVFYDVVFFAEGNNNVAERFAQHVKKGSTVLITGELETNTYLSKKDGSTQIGRSITATNWTFVGGGKKEDGGISTETRQLANSLVGASELPF